jgi:hypothetical protein
VVVDKADEPEITRTMGSGGTTYEP